MDEDQLSLAIGRNGQNVRLASQLIGWQIDLYGSREWLERGADLSLFGETPSGDQYETSDFPLSELELDKETLAALEEAGYHTFLDIIDLEKDDFLKVPGLSETEADRLLVIIDELTVVEGEAGAEAPVEAESMEGSSNDEGDEGEKVQGEEKISGEGSEVEEEDESEPADDLGDDVATLTEAELPEDDEASSEEEDETQEREV